MCSPPICSRVGAGGDGVPMDCDTSACVTPQGVCVRVCLGVSVWEEVIFPMKNFGNSRLDCSHKSDWNNPPVQKQAPRTPTLWWVGVKLDNARNKREIELLISA